MTPLERPTRPRRARLRRLAVPALVAALVAAALSPLTPANAGDAPAAPAARGGGHDRTADGNLIAVNDFHGAIDKPTGSGGLVNGVPAGGVEYLTTYVKRLRARRR